MYYNYEVNSIDAIILKYFAIVMLILVAFSILMIVDTWKIYKKAGHPGWASLIPGYKDWVLAEIIWGNGWFFLAAFVTAIPRIGGYLAVAYIIISYIKLAKAFGKGVGFGFGLILLNPIFLTILAFDNSKYVGTSGINWKMNNDPDEDIRFCTDCGTKLESNASFCTNCGKKVR